MNSSMHVDQPCNQSAMFKFSQQEDQIDMIENQISFRNVRISPEECQWNCQLCARKSTLRIDPFQNVPKGW